MQTASFRVFSMSEIMAGTSVSDMAKNGEAPGDRYYDEPIIDEGTASALSLTDKAHKAGQAGPLDAKPEPTVAAVQPPSNDSPKENYSADPVAAEFTSAMNAAGMAPEAVKQALQWHNETTQAEIAELQVMDEESQAKGSQVRVGIHG